MDTLQQQVAKVKQLQQEMDAIITELKETYGYTLGEPLVDQDQFPRADLDVYNVSKLVGRYRRLHREWGPLRKAVEERVMARYSKDEEMP